MAQPIYLTFLQGIMFCLFFELTISSKQTVDEEQRNHDPKHLMRENSARWDFNLFRRKLPNALFSTPYNLRCGSYRSIALRGPDFFFLNSPRWDCGLAFIGSRAQNCTVAIICKDETSIEPADNCSDGYVTFWDGTYGMMNACGNFSFHDVPRFPRNGGTDMYVNYKGKANSGSVCAAFCKEELTEAHYEEAKIKSPKRLKKTSLYEKPKKDKGCVCGKKSEQTGRIVGGSDITPFEFPWLAVIVRKSEVIKRKIVDSIQLTSTNIPGYGLPITTDESSLRVDVAKVIDHPLYDAKNYDYDIALLELAVPVEILHRNFTPICLTDLERIVRYPDNAMFTLAGWGLPYEDSPSTTRIPKQEDVPLGKCRMEWQKATSRHICAGYLSGGRDACDGDSGSPLMYKFRPDTDQYMLAGIVSDGIGCARPDVLGFYTNIQELLQWIYLKMDAPDNTFCST